jgi:hypothetical protein
MHQSLPLSLSNPFHVQQPSSKAWKWKYAMPPQLNASDVLYQSTSVNYPAAALVHQMLLPSKVTRKYHQ